MLEKYNPCIDGLDYFKENFPHGATPSEVLDTIGVPKEYLHFGRKYLDLTEEEIQKYEAVCGIYNSTKCFYSENIKDSNIISKSNNVTNSNNVRFSNNIYYSNNIFYSNKVNISKEILNSIDIDNCEKVIDSKQVATSTNIINSNVVEWSRNILNSLNIDECSYIYQSTNLYNCHFCGYLTNCTNCLFCSGLDGKEYYIFNKEVGQNEFERLCEKAMYLQEKEQNLFITINDKNLFTNRFEYSRRFDSIFNGIGPDFFGWIGTLEQFDKQVFLQLFFEDIDFIK